MLKYNPSHTQVPGGYKVGSLQPAIRRVTALVSGFQEGSTWHNFHVMFSPNVWLPLVLATTIAPQPPVPDFDRACTPHFKPNNDVIHFAATASIVPAIVTLDGVQIGHPVDTRPGELPCDQIASVGVDDGTVRGVANHIRTGFSVPIIGNVGELIEFRWNAARPCSLGVHPWVHP